MDINITNVTEEVAEAIEREATRQKRSRVAQLRLILEQAAAKIESGEQKQSEKVTQ